MAYDVYLVIMLITGMTLGTRSFTAANEAAPPLAERLSGCFKIFENAALLEFIALIIITAVLADKYLVMIYKREVKTRKFKDLNWSKSEIISLIGAYLLLLFAAYIESRKILS